MPLHEQYNESYGDGNLVAGQKMFSARESDVVGRDSGEVHPRNRQLAATRRELVDEPGGAPQGA
jgi:hypothetical protein